MKPNSLAFRLIATLAAWTLIVLPVAGFLIYRLYRNDVQGAFDGEIEKIANAIALDAMSGPGPDPVTPESSYQPFFGVTHSGWYWQVKPLDNSAGKRLVSDSLATATLLSPIESNVEAGESGARWMIGTGPKGEPLRIVEIIDTIGHEEKGPRYSIIVAGPWDWLTSKLQSFLTRLTTSLTLTGLGLVAFTVFQVRFGLLPLQRIEKDLAAIRSGAAGRLEGEAPAEIESLQEELNALIDSNQEIIERARTQVGNLAHALKTPLAVITNEAREEKSAFGAKVAEQAELMRHQINTYLERARMAARAGIIGRSTDIKAVAEPLARTLERINRDKGVTIALTCPDGASFKGERQDLEEMLGNLLDNACKWAKTSVALAVSLPAAEGKAAQKRRVVIRVEDDGPGLTAEQRAKIGKRGLRLDESKPGSGLGLSIVADLAASYRGSMSLEVAERGGLCVRLELPAA